MTVTSTRSISPSAKPPAAYVASSWSPCSASCGGGQQTRDVLCLHDGYVTADLQACQGLPAVAVLQSCNTDPCLTPFWLVTSTWSQCSLPCSSNSSSLGVATRDAAVCVHGGSLMDASVCALAGLPQPPTSRACNRFTCPPAWHAWQTTPWSVCSSTVGCGLGQMSRNVSCVTSDGSIVSDALCNSTAMPSSRQSCDTGVSCPCTASSPDSEDSKLSDRFCEASVGKSSICDAVSGVCVCKAGWAGPDCNTTTTLPSAAERLPVCTIGTPDVNGRCCSAIDAVTGLCCNVGAAVASNGRCCDGGQLDGCGVCNGTGIMLDRDGHCCDAPVAANGVCCLDTSGVDSCGLCAGVNHCGADAQVTLEIQSSMTVPASNGSVNASAVADWDTPELEMIIGGRQLSIDVVLLA